MGLQIAFEPDAEIDEALLVRLSGALEVNGAEDLWVWASGIAGPDARFFLFDLSRLNILTSAGIGVMVRIFVRLKTFGGAIAVYGCSDKIREVFTVVMLEGVLNVSATEAQARGVLQKLAAN